MERIVFTRFRTVKERTIDFVIEEGRIVQIEQGGTLLAHADVDGEYCIYASSGWIDMHTHAFPEFQPYGDQVDAIGYQLGVTTIVDAGSTGSDRIADLLASCQKARTNVLSFLNISSVGLARVDELSTNDWLQEQALLRAIHDYGEQIVGLKARISRSVVQENGIAPLREARRIADQTKKPLMVHIGSGPPDVRRILQLLKKGDILTHYLNGKPNNVFDENGVPYPELLEAIERGIHLDVGHGSASFSFQIAEQAKKYGITFNTISTDIYQENRLNGPVYSMSNVLTKFLALGYPLAAVIGAVTVQPASWLKRPELGRLVVGDLANVTLFSVDQKPVTLVDSEGIERRTNRSIHVQGVIVNGEYFS
ncbi:amidohydrolase/deacetylase family metallohydrolase [Bacillaceae bacterium SIJ1]|uniref:amidohydrolase/deacetylase family metallohydrolase n=1 Tax=Litoribacterium kuwaitense TaxID=1398745 RepID=UPI0013EC6BAA|nr:amidohydrolase/deacetylase family metallohydrolase [Litoribacterium kuwaitense]NGP46389.1 amidohydrolase/deacetylase family metallohydrolase [Litoribacterium kuwaitense]